MAAKAEPLSELIVETLTKEIITGQLAPGSILDSVSLAKRFQTSRTPVREALLALANQGLTSIEASRRARVTELSVTRIEQLYAVRIKLLELAAELAVDSMTEAKLDLLRDAERSVIEAVDSRDNYRISIAFAHVGDVIAKMSDNEILIGTLGALRLQMLHVINYLGIRNPSYDDVVNDHTRLLRAFTERDKALALALVRSLTTRTVNWFRDANNKFLADANERLRPHGRKGQGRPKAKSS